MSAPRKTPDAGRSAALATPDARRDYARLVWCGCRAALEAVATASLSPEPVHQRLGMDEQYVRALLQGKRRLTIDTFAYIATTLGLDPAIVFRTAAQDAVRLLLNHED